MVVSFEPTDEFMYYADGVFVSGEEKIHQEWQKARGRSRRARRPAQSL